MALGLQISRLIPLFPNGIFLQWDLVSPTEAGVYAFQISRSGSPNGPWEVIRTANNTYHYTDSLPTTTTPPEGSIAAPNLLSLSRSIYYRVVTTPPSGAANAATAVSAVEPTLDGRQRLLKRKMIRDETLMLTKLNGVPAAVLKRLHWGTRCTVCYDKYTRSSVRADCIVCYGVGFVGGYHAPVQIYCRRGVTSVQTQLTPEGNTDVSLTQITMLDVPKMEKEDLLVFLADNRRFIVTQALPTELRTVVVHQKLMVSELARSNVEYRIPVDPTRVPKLF